MTTRARRPRTKPKPKRLRIVMIGAGRLARALLPLLEPSGYRVVAVAAPRLASARQAARSCRDARATTRPVSVLNDVDLVLLAVPDRVLRGLACELAQAEGVDWTKLVALHHAGAWGPELLEPLAHRGAGTGVLHPLQCLGDAPTAARVLPGSAARIEGDARGLHAARRMALALGLVPLELPASRLGQRRADYHAAAALVANDLVALIDFGRQLLRRAGVDEATSRRALASLAHGTLMHYREAGEASALTGPVSRGDVETLRAHLDRLSDIEGAAEVHALLSQRLTMVLRRHGGAATARAARRALRLARSEDQAV